jgi:hypothetical protein
LVSSSITSSGAPPVGPLHQQRDVELAEALAMPPLQMFLADRQDARPGIDGLGLGSGAKGHGRARP